MWALLPVLFYHILHIVHQVTCLRTVEVLQVICRFKEFLVYIWMNSTLAMKWQFIRQGLFRCQSTLIFPSPWHFIPTSCSDQLTWTFSLPLHPKEPTYDPAAFQWPNGQCFNCSICLLRCRFIQRTPPLTTYFLGEQQISLRHVTRSICLLGRCFKMSSTSLP